MWTAYQMFNVGGTQSAHCYSDAHEITPFLNIIQWLSCSSAYSAWMLLPTLFPQLLTPATSSGPISRLTTSQTCCFRISTRDGEFSNSDLIEMLLSNNSFGNFVCSLWRSTSHDVLPQPRHIGHVCKDTKARNTSKQILHQSQELPGKHMSSCKYVRCIYV